MKNQVFYFPFTHLTQKSARILNLFFESVCMLDITGKSHLKDAGAIQWMHLSSELLNKVDNVFAQYLEWIKIHKGNEHNLKLLLKENPYFTTDSQITTIKSRLKRSGQEDRNKTFQAVIEQKLLFLKAAGLCDAQNESIDRNLSRIDQEKESLIGALKGELSSDLPLTAGLAPALSDQGELMTAQRVDAWGKCLAAVKEIKVPELPVFVTTSRAVFDLIESNHNPCLNALDIDGIKVHENECENQISWQQAFAKELLRAVRGLGFKKEVLPGIDDACGLKGRFCVKLFQGNEISLGFDLSERQVAVCLVELK